MTLIYETQTFKRSIPTGLEGEVNDFINQAKNQKPEDLKRLLDRHGPYLKKRLGKFRIIAKLKYIDEIPTLILINIYARGDNRYEEFNANPEGFGELHLEPIINGELNKIYEFVKENKPIIPPKKPLPDYFYRWLSSSSLTYSEEEILIYETIEWCEKIKSPNFSKYQIRFYDILFKLVNQPEELNTIVYNNALKISFIQERSDYKILYAEFSTVNIPKVILLILPLTDPGQPDQDVVNIYTNFLSTNQQLSTNELAQISYRVYPWYILADEQLWLDIENDSQANLALSSEEENTLQELTSSQNPTLPAFINGRAGSGKSTMLYYMFSTLVHKKLREDLDGEIIFITYNDKLLQIARKTVENILNSHALFAGERKINQSDISPFFKTFHDLIFDILPEEEKEKFKPEKRLTFYKFKSRLWKNIYNKPQYLSPELAWFIIRAYIKGYKENTFMTPEEYEELPKKEKNVSENIFKDVYEHVWNYYHRICLENNYWDDQDLVRTALSENNPLWQINNVPEYIAIFCDEAQDFTRVELRFLMRLSIFSKYQLQPGTKTILILFAGDPMQTINPTGFRWETTGAIFHEEIIQEIDPENKLDLRLYFKELQYNYRSSPSITKFSNLILMWRSSFSDLRLNPQKPWKTYQEGPKPYRLVIRDEIKDKLKEILRDKIVIIPTEEEQLTNFIKNDPLLNEIFSTVDENWPPKNVLTPISAKGLEFDDVIVYKFGESFKNLTAENKLEDILKTSRASFEIDYFFNQLYVSTSRAKKNLFIIDTTAGNDLLWRYTNEDLIFEPFPENFQIDNWKGFITSSQIGEIQSLTLTTEEKRKNALEFKEKGIDNRDPSLLKRAAQFFDEIGDTIEKNECIAYAFKFEEKYREAAEIFKQLNNPEQVKECLILGELWNELYNFYLKNPDFQSEPAFELVKFIISPQNEITTFIRFTQFLKKHITDKAYINIIKSKAEWKTAIEKYNQIILSINNPELIDQKTLLDCISILQILEQALGRNGRKALALALYYYGDFKEACSLWEKIEETEHENYYIAKSQVLKPPHNLKYLLKLGKYEEIIKLWEEFNEPFDDITWIEAVKEALLKTSHIDEIIKFYLKINKPESAFEKFNEFIETSNDPTHIFNLSKEIFNLTAPNKITPLDKFMDETKKLTLTLKFMEILFQKVISQWNEKAKVFTHVFNYIAYSDISYDDKKNLSEKFENILKEFHHQTLLKYLNIEEISSILEKTCSYIYTLNFYYNYIEGELKLDRTIHDIIKENLIELKKRIYVASTDPDILFVMKRIVKVKLKQAEYHKSRNEDDKYQSSVEEANKLAKLFNLDLNEINEEPFYPQPFPVKFEGFSIKPELKSLSEYEKYFIYYPFEIKINRRTKLILITNTENYDTKKISTVDKFPDKYSYQSYELIIENPSQNCITIEFRSGITGTMQTEGKVTINF